jgi:hypothetical protein
MICKIEITITTYPGEAELVAELWGENVMCCAIRWHHDSRAFSLELFPPANGSTPVFDLQAFEAAIARAKERLLQIEGSAT